MREIYYVFEREMKLWVRQKWIFAILTITPALYVSVFSTLMNYFLQSANVPYQSTIDYVSFYAVGAVSIYLMQVSMIGALSVFLDRQSGVLEDILTSPLGRAYLYFGKLLATSVKSLSIASIILLISIAVGAKYQPDLLHALLAAGVMVSSSIAFASFSITITSIIKDQATYNTVINLLFVPLLLLSNIYYPVNIMPSWAKLIVKANPLTYITNALRTTLVFNRIPDVTDLAAIFLFIIAFASLGVLGYKKMKI